MNKKSKIIIIEDQIILNDSLKQAISSKYDVVATSLSAKDMLKLCEKYKPDLILTDICTLENSNGITNGKKVKETKTSKNGKKYEINSKANPYMKAFIGDIDLRKTCPTCKFAKLPRYTDFTLGDFWGVDNCYPELNRENKGTSLILVHTEKFISVFISWFVL